MIMPGMWGRGWAGRDLRGGSVARISPRLADFSIMLSPPRNIPASVDG